MKGRIPYKHIKYSLAKPTYQELRRSNKNEFFTLARNEILTIFTVLAAKFPRKGMERKYLTLKYRSEIDGLRALAIIPVILFHADFKAFSGGFIGVDIFFVISGYLITSIIIEDLKNNSFSIARFYERRARRILPALFFVMGTCIPFGWMWMQPGQLIDFSESLIAVSLFVSNFLFWSESGYFASASEEKPLLHTWSLAVEEQYYLLFPLFLILTWRFGRNWVFWLIISMAVISLFYSEWGWRNEKTANFYLAPARVWELLAGSLVALIIEKKGLQSSNIISFFGILAIVLSIIIFDEKTPFPSIYTLLPVVGVSLVILFGDNKTVTAKFLSIDALVKLGLISYSAYLWHQPLFAFARVKLIQQPPISLMVALILASFFIASFSWRFIEQPFRNKNSYFSQKSIFLFASSGMITFIVIGVYGLTQNGFPERYSILLKGDVGHLDYHKYIDKKYHDCEPKEISDEALSWDGFLRCKQSKKGEADWILLGDSHAEHLFLGLAEKFSDKNIVFYIFGAAPYMDEPKFSKIFYHISNFDEPKTILLNMHYIERIVKKSEFQNKLDKTIKTLKKTQHNVILVGDIPKYKVHPADCIYGNSLEKAKDYCSMPMLDFDKQRQLYENSLLYLASKNHIKYIPIHQPLCDFENCSMIKMDKILYRDKNHLNILGSKLVGAYLAKQLK